MKTVVKVQKALNSNNRVLIYNKERTVFQELEGSDATVLATAMGDRNKCYFNVRIDNAGMMHIIKETRANF